MALRAGPATVPGDGWMGGWVMFQKKQKKIRKARRNASNLLKKHPWEIKKDIARVKTVLNEKRKEA